MAGPLDRAGSRGYSPGMMPQAARAPATDASRRKGFDPLVYADPRPWPPLIHAFGIVNRLWVLPHLLRVRRIDLPDADLARLRAAVRPGTAAFIAPNHPEFFTDWMLDKEISRRISPLMAHWASYEVVNASPLTCWLGLRNNLIANVPGGGGREYSVGWALRGHGVLLHPEGTSRWQSDRVGSLLPGIVQMAGECCRRAREAGRSMPVSIVGVVWKLRFAGDVSVGLHREMRLIERRLELPSGGGLRLERRFAALEQGLLRRECERFGVAAPAACGDGGVPGFFEAQRALAAAMRRELEQRHGPVAGEFGRLQHVLRRALRQRAAADPEGSGRDRARLDQLGMWAGFAPELYDTPTLSQEAIAESLKRIRLALVTGGLGAAFHNAAPVPVGRRIAHLRVPEPLAAAESHAAGAEGARRHRAGLLEALRDRMQQTLDRLNAEIAPEVDRWRRPNPLWSGARGR